MHATKEKFIKRSSLASIFSTTSKQLSRYHQLHSETTSMAATSENGVKHTYALSETHKDVSFSAIGTTKG
jgi:hypothetical protein